MHWLYDKEEAKRWLHANTERDSQGVEAGEQLRLLRTENCRAEWYTEPRCYRIIGDDDMEATFKVTGVICSLTLPPITRPLRSKSPTHVRYLRQFVRLTGLGTESFNELEERITDINGMIQTVTEHGTIMPATSAKYEGQFAIDIRARYLTERKTVPGLAHIPFTADIDPRHILEDARDLHFVRTEDNVVQYSKRNSTMDGRSSHVPQDPKVFREGDIVEATLTFIGYLCGEKVFKIVPTLRALALVNSKFREDADAKRLRHDESLRRPSTPRQPRREPQQAKTLKRKYITYSEDWEITEEGRGEHEMF